MILIMNRIAKQSTSESGISSQPTRDTHTLWCRAYFAGDYNVAMALQINVAWERERAAIDVKRMYPCGITSHRTASQTK